MFITTEIETIPTIKSGTSVSAWVWLRDQNGRGLNAWHCGYFKTTLEAESEAGLIAQKTKRLLESLGIDAAIKEHAL